MNTTRSPIARLEGGANPTIKMLRRYVEQEQDRIKLSKKENVEKAQGSLKFIQNILI